MRMKICSTCGGLFIVKTWQHKHGHSECPSCTESDPRWTSEYRSARAERLLIAKGACERCGAGGSLEAHHVNGNRGDHRVTNLQMLCNACHLVATRAMSRRGSVRSTRSQAMRLT